jgi:hypothetical protein
LTASTFLSFLLCFCPPDSATPFGSITLLRLTSSLYFFPFTTFDHSHVVSIFDHYHYFSALVQHLLLRFLKNYRPPHTAPCSITFIHNPPCPHATVEAKRFHHPSAITSLLLLNHKTGNLLLELLHREDRSEKHYCLTSPSCRPPPLHPPYRLRLGLPTTPHAVHHAKAPSPNNRRTRSDKELRKINW